MSGQASLKGEGAPVRDEAIRRAVADAKEQAEVAAQAAGVKLGQVLSMQVSSSGYPYPLEAGAASNGVGDLSRELDYMRQHSAFAAVQLVNGTEPFSSSGH